MTSNTFQGSKYRPSSGIRAQKISLQESDGYKDFWPELFPSPELSEITSSFPSYKLRRRVSSRSQNFTSTPFGFEELSNLMRRPLALRRNSWKRPENVLGEGNYERDDDVPRSPEEGPVGGRGGVRPGWAAVSSRCRPRVVPCRPAVPRRGGCRRRASRACLRPRGVHRQAQGCAQRAGSSLVGVPR